MPFIMKFDTLEQLTAAEDILEYVKDFVKHAPNKFVPQEEAHEDGNFDDAWLYGFEAMHYEVAAELKENVDKLDKK